MRACGDLVSRAADGPGNFAVEQAEIGIDRGCAGLHQAKRANKIKRHPQVADMKVVDCTLCLCTVQSVFRHMQFTETVSFNTGFGQDRFLQVVEYQTVLIARSVRNPPVAARNIR
jgi:hypothetical protein